MGAKTQQVKFGIIGTGAIAGVHAEALRCAENAALGVPPARAGTHILCEKPLEITTAKSDKLIRACEASGVLLTCNFNVQQPTRNVQFSNLIIGHSLLAVGYSKKVSPCFFREPRGLHLFEST